MVISNDVPPLLLQLMNGPKEQSKVEKQSAKSSQKKSKTPVKKEPPSREVTATTAQAGEISASVDVGRELAAIREILKEQSSKQELQFKQLSGEISTINNRLDHQSKKIGEQSQKFDEQSQKFDEQSQKIDEQSQKIDEQSQKFDEQFKELSLEVQMIKKRTESQDVFLKSKLGEQSRSMSEQNLRLESLGHSISKIAETTSNITLINNLKLQNIYHIPKDLNQADGRTFYERNVKPGEFNPFPLMRKVLKRRGRDIKASDRDLKAFYMKETTEIELDGLVFLSSSGKERKPMLKQGSAETFGDESEMLESIKSKPFSHLREATKKLPRIADTIVIAETTTGKFVDQDAIVKKLFQIERAVIFAAILYCGHSRAKLEKYASGDQKIGCYSDAITRNIHAQLILLNQSEKIRENSIGSFFGKKEVASRFPALIKLRNQQLFKVCKC